MSKYTLNYLFLILYCILLTFKLTSGSIVDYIPFGNSLFGNSNENIQNDQNTVMQKVPYEVAVTDEKFIEQAAKFTGVALSELDKCQHRVVLKLQQDCHKLNDEQLAKLAVKLLNCQSDIEGRKIYPCTDAMPIRDCTSAMDTDTWNSYLLMSNRARAVCYSVRQAQFRGLTELTVNKLMGAAHDQLDIMHRIKDGQYRLEQATSETLQSVVRGNDVLKQQQSDLQQAQFHGQLVLEDNIKRLVDEKQLIVEGHEQLASMTKDVKDKLEEAAKQIENQAEERKDNHREILNDLVLIQQQAEIIFMRIEESSKHMLEQSQLAAQQYEATLVQLSQMNATVYALVDVMTTTRSALEEKLNWLSQALGGTDNAVERLYMFVSHITYLIIAMVLCAFLQIPVTGRVALSLLVPMNLFVALQQGTQQAFSFIGMTAILVSFVAVQLTVFALLNLKKNGRTALKLNSKPANSTPTKVNSNSEYTENKTLNGSSVGTKNFNGYHEHKSGYENQSFDDTKDEMDDVVDDHIFRSPTPPSSRYGASRSRSNTPNLLHLGSTKKKCNATTRMGTPCSLTAQLGREFCFRHQAGSSVIMS